MGALDEGGAQGLGAHVSADVAAFAAEVSEFSLASVPLPLLYCASTLRKGHDLAVWGLTSVSGMRSKLAPRASRLAPRASRLAPRASRLAPRASRLAPRASRLAPLKWHDSPSGPLGLPGRPYRTPYFDTDCRDKWRCSFTLSRFRPVAEVENGTTSSSACRVRRAAHRRRHSLCARTRIFPALISCRPPGAARVRNSWPIPISPRLMSVLTLFEGVPITAWESRKLGNFTRRFSTVSAGTRIWTIRWRWRPPSLPSAGYSLTSADQTPGTVGSSRTS